MGCLWRLFEGAFGAGITLTFTNELLLQRLSVKNIVLGSEGVNRTIYN